MDKKRKIILEIIFFSTILKITVGGFVNQLIKKLYPNEIFGPLHANNKDTDCAVSAFAIQLLEKCLHFQSKKGGKDQESIQSSTTPVPGYHMGKWHKSLMNL